MKSTVMWMGLACLLGPTAQAAETIEALGGERCGPARGGLTVTFLAPEDGQVEATARAQGADGTADRTRMTAGMTVDGRDCTDGACRFRAVKGQSYSLAAKSAVAGAVTLCISVSRPT